MLQAPTHKSELFVNVTGRKATRADLGEVSCVATESSTTETLERTDRRFSGTCAAGSLLTVCRKETEQTGVLLALVLRAHC